MRSYGSTGLGSLALLTSRTEPIRRRIRSRWIPLAPALVYLLTCAPIATAQGFVSPTRIAEGAPGKLLVSDYAAEAIFVVDKQSLQTIWTIPIKGTPMGVARLGLLMFVGNERTESVEVYEIDEVKQKAKLSSTLGPRLTDEGPGFFRRPTDIAIDPGAGLIFVLDLGDRLIKVFDASGNFINTFPPAVTGQPVSFVAAIEVDVVRQEILVTDHGNAAAGIPARILVLNYTGVYQRQINGNGYVDGVGTVSSLQFARPQGLVADRAGHVFMLDPVLGTMIVFDENTILDADNVAVIKRLDGFGSCTDLVLDANSGDVFAVNNRMATLVVVRGGGSIQ